MKSLLNRLITEPIVGEVARIECVRNGHGDLEKIHGISISDVIDNQLIEEFSQNIMDNITKESIDLTPITKPSILSLTVNNIVTMCLTLGTYSVMVGSQTYVQIKQELFSNNHHIYKEIHKLNSMDSILLNYDKTITIYCNGFLGWDYQYIHFLNPIELDGGLEKHLNIKTTDGVCKLTSQPIKLPTNFKLKIC